MCIDRAELISKLSLKKGETVQQIYQCYLIVLKGGKSRSFVRQLPSWTKDKKTKHLKSTKGKKGRLVNFSISKKFSMSKKKLLASCSVHDFEWDKISTVIYCIESCWLIIFIGKHWFCWFIIIKIKTLCIPLSWEKKISNRKMCMTLGYLR